MIVVRFRVESRPDQTDQVLAAFRKVVGPSRAVEGVVSFDIGQDVSDPNSFIATEVFEDRAALERQESLPEVAETLSVLEQALAAPPEATIYNVSSSEPWGE
jgi:quinol monooxygenase YgiN